MDPVVGCELGVERRRQQLALARGDDGAVVQCRERLDVATDARPEQVQKLFPRTYAVGAHFGVIVVLENGFQFEVATFRSDGAYLDGRHPVEVHFATAEEDATRRDFTNWARALFWSLLALIGFGLITLFVAIPGGNVIYAALGLVLFGFYTIFDFNRLKRASDIRVAPAIAAGIFLDLFNVFLFFLSLFGGGRR